MGATFESEQSNVASQAGDGEDTKYRLLWVRRRREKNILFSISKIALLQLQVFWPQVVGALLKGLTRRNRNKLNTTRPENPRLEVDVVGGVDRGGHPVDGMRHGHPSPQLRIVFDIVHPVSKGLNGASVFFINPCVELVRARKDATVGCTGLTERPASSCSQPEKGFAGFAPGKAYILIRYIFVAWVPPNHERHVGATGIAGAYTSHEGIKQETPLKYIQRNVVKDPRQTTGVRNLQQ